MLPQFQKCDSKFSTGNVLNKFMIQMPINALVRLLVVRAMGFESNVPYLIPTKIDQPLDSDL